MYRSLSLLQNVANDSLASQVLPPLDLLYYLTNSIKTGRMVITIPWIVEFLNGIDNTSILLPVYKMLLSKLQYLLYKLKLPSAEGDATVADDTLFVRLAYSDDACKLFENIERNGTPRTISVRELRTAAASRASTDDDESARRFVDDRIQTIDYSRILIALYVNSLFNNVPASTVIKIEGW